MGCALALTVYAALGLALLILSVVSLALIVVWVGLPLIMVCVPAQRALANQHRRLAGWLLGAPIRSAYLRVDERGLVARPVALVRAASTWRDLSWLLVNSSVGLALSIGAIVETVFDLLLFLPGSVLLTIDAHLIRGMLAPSERAELAKRVQDLTESRAETVDTQAAELRRIERDLHDGAQARLVSLGMSLGLAEERLEADPSQARQLLAEARAANSQALAELRDLVRGIHPPVLADRGLVGALQALVLATPLEVELVSELSGRLPAPVESAAYFAVAEALTNVIKHSTATRARIELSRPDARLLVHVSDDGLGGADPANGTGLRGIARRLSAFDGRLEVSSPTGGPTVLSME
ncbi:MAG: Signal transduction histidine kinase [Frankiales bacterium]|nr:Signal transduction histidine kinase [Frankiales bacterium]